MALAACTWLFQGDTVSAGPVTIHVHFAGNPTQLQKDLFDEAVSEWTDFLRSPTFDPDVVVEITVTFKNLGTHKGGDTTGHTADSSGLPTGANIEINTNPIVYYGASDQVPANKFDALTSMKHELGHALGFSTTFDLWNDQVPPGTRIFDPHGLNVTMAGTGPAGRSHLSDTAEPGDLMDLTTPPGERRTPSTLDFKMLSVAFGYQVVPEPSSLTLASVATLGLLAYYGTRGLKRGAAE